MVFTLFRDHGGMAVLDAIFKYVSPTFASPDALVGFCWTCVLPWGARIRFSGLRTMWITSGTLRNSAAETGGLMVWSRRELYHDGVSTMSIAGFTKSWKSVTFGGIFQGYGDDPLGQLLDGSDIPKVATLGCSAQKPLRICSKDNHNLQVSLPFPYVPFKFHLLRKHRCFPQASHWRREAWKLRPDSPEIDLGDPDHRSPGLAGLRWAGCWKLAHALRNRMNWCQFCEFWVSDMSDGWFLKAKDGTKRRLRCSGAQAASTGSPAAALWIGEVPCATKHRGSESEGDLGL